jgi:isoleucyl-tRNA synthetase
MAPILSFTAEEIWCMLPKGAVPNPGHWSVHLASFPEARPDWNDAALAQRWDRLLEVRTAVQAALEEKRRDKVIGSSLEAYVLIETNQQQYEFLSQYVSDLPSFLIVSSVEVKQSPVLLVGAGTGFTTGMRFTIQKSTERKCERCWNYRPSVGQDRSHPTLCDRCLEAIR